MVLESIQVGHLRTAGTPDAADPFDRPWTSGIWKEPVVGPVPLGVDGLAGDQIADRRHHGGPHRAVLMYSGDHYPAWRAEWGRKDVGPGAFGENLTVSGMTERTVCVGDQFAIGDTVLEVASPRGPCDKLSRKHAVRDLVQVVRATHRHGWYLRVIREGSLEAGAQVRLLDRPYPQWSVARVAAVHWDRGNRPEESRLLAACPALDPEWREKLRAVSGSVASATR
ncbi:MAG: MOSC domain-containing protein [Gemmatimonadota bacterium]|mgnify:FL=1